MSNTLGPGTVELLQREYPRASQVPSERQEIELLKVRLVAAEAALTNLIDALHALHRRLGIMHG